jgi:hypothetical protein
MQIRFKADSMQFSSVENGKDWGIIAMNWEKFEGEKPDLEERMEGQVPCVFSLFLFLSIQEDSSPPLMQWVR